MALPVREHQGFQCLVSVPEPAGTDLLPLLVFLHGNGEAGPPPDQPANIQDRLTRHGPMSRHAASIAGSFIIVAPQLPHPGGNVWAARAKAVEALAREAATAYQCDPARTYLTGFSFGGTGVLALGAQADTPWAACWAVDPRYPPTRLLQRPLWLSGGLYAADAGQYTALGFTGPEGGAANNSIYQFVDSDHIVCARRSYGDPRPYQWLLQDRM